MGLYIIESAKRCEADVDDYTAGLPRVQRMPAVLRRHKALYGGRRGDGGNWSSRFVIRNPLHSHGNVFFSFARVLVSSLAIARVDMCP